MVLCLHGRLSVLVSGRRYEFSRGVLCFISPLIHLHVLSMSDDAEIATITDDDERLYPAVKPLFSSLLKYRLFKEPCLNISEEQIGLFMQTKQRIEQKLTSDQPNSGEEVRLTAQIVLLLEQEIMMEFLSLYFHSRTLPPVDTSSSASVAYEFIQSVHQNFRANRAVEFYANQANLSTGHFSVIVKQITGHTPSVWIHSVTIANAKILLSRDGVSVKQVADELNFPEQFTFRKYFKHYVGISPKAYQRQSADLQ